MKRHKTNQSRPALYGFHAVREAWLNPKRQIHQLYVLQNSLGGFEETLEKAQKQGLKRPPPTVVDKNQIDKMLPREAIHQGLVLICDLLENMHLSDLIIQSLPASNATILMLDQVTDPHNVGAILRSASAFGAAGVIMQRKHAPELTGVLAKTASGAVEHIPVAFETNLSRALEELKQNGFFAYGLDETGEIEISGLKPGKSVLVLGAEGSGLRRLVKENCDVLVRLPTQGPIGSLNVSNAAAVALYALAAK